MLQVHAGWRLAYREADVPRDMLVYTQTSPDVQRVINEIDELSALLTGGKHLPVVYDSHVSWPFQWYLRDYDSKRFIGDAAAGASEDAAVIVASCSSRGNVAARVHRDRVCVALVVPGRDVS